MKTLAFFAMLVASLAAYGQKVSLMPSYSIGFGQTEADLKNIFNLNLGISYEWNDHAGISLQTSKESWAVSSRANTNVSLQANSIQFYFHQSLDKESEWFLAYSAGILIGIGSPIGDNAADLQLLKHPYFAGVSLKGGVGKKIAKNFSLTACVKLDAIGGVITDRAATYENLTNNGSLFCVLELGYYLK